MMAWNRSNVTAKVMYTEPIRNVWIKPNIIRIMHSPPRNTLDVYQVDITGRPNERMAASRNKASNAAKPLNRLEKDAPLLSPPLQIGLEVLSIFVWKCREYSTILLYSWILSHSMAKGTVVYLRPVAVLVKTITDMVFPMKPKVETRVKMTPSVRYLNISSWSSNSEIKILVKLKINKKYVSQAYFLLIKGSGFHLQIFLSHHC